MDKHDIVAPLIHLGWGQYARVTHRIGRNRDTIIFEKDGIVISVVVTVKEVNHDQKRTGETD